jgi:hypothetical protein
MYQLILFFIIFESAHCAWIFHHSDLKLNHGGEKSTHTQTLQEIQSNS